MQVREPPIGIPCLSCSLNRNLQNGPANMNEYTRTGSHCSDILKLHVIALDITWGLSLSLPIGAIPGPFNLKRRVAMVALSFLWIFSQPLWSFVTALMIPYLGI